MGSLGSPLPLSGHGGAGLAGLLAVPTPPGFGLAVPTPPGFGVAVPTPPGFGVVVGVLQQSSCGCRGWDGPSTARRGEELARPRPCRSEGLPPPLCPACLLQLSPGWARGGLREAPAVTLPC